MYILLMAFGFSFGILLVLLAIQLAIQSSNEFISRLYQNRNDYDRFY